MRNSGAASLASVSGLSSIQRRFRLAWRGAPVEKTARAAGDAEKLPEKEGRAAIWTEKGAIVGENMACRELGQVAKMAHFFKVIFMVGY